VDRFEAFTAYLISLAKERPYKIAGDAACGYWMAIESMARAAELAMHQPATSSDGVEHGKPKVKATLQSDGVLYNTKTPSATPTHAPDPERIASHACGYGCIERGHPEPDCPKHGWVVSECPSNYLTSRDTW
jgi:hypothetical protein